MMMKNFLRVPFPVAFRIETPLSKESVIEIITKNIPEKHLIFNTYFSDTLLRKKVRNFILKPKEDIFYLYLTKYQEAGTPLFLVSIKGDAKGTIIQITPYNKYFMLFVALIFLFLSIFFLCGPQLGIIGFFSMHSIDPGLVVVDCFFAFCAFFIPVIYFKQIDKAKKKFLSLFDQEKFKCIN
jgi:hypothetical protein